MTPSTILSARSTSPPKSAWPGVSTMLILLSLNWIAVFLARMVIPRSFSSSFESITRSATASLARKVPAWRSMASTRVVLPWSTWAMMAIFRMGKLTGAKFLFFRFAESGWLLKTLTGWQRQAGQRGRCLRYSLPASVTKAAPYPPGGAPRGALLGGCPGRFHRPHDSLRLIYRFLILRLWHRISNDPSAGLDVPLLPLEEHAPDRDAGIKVPRKIRVEDAAPVRPTPRRLQLFDNLHRPDLWGATQRAGGKTSAEGIHC